MSFLSFVPPRRRRLQEAILKKAQTMYRTRVPRYQAIDQIREMAKGDKRALNPIYIGNVSVDSVESRSITRLLLEAANVERGSGQVDSPEYVELLDLPSNESFALLAQDEPKLRSLEDFVIASRNANPSFGMNYAAQKEIEREVGLLVGPNAPGAVGRMASPLAPTLAMRYLLGLAQSQEPHSFEDDWWPADQ